jgi:hypothetical protein
MGRERHLTCFGRTASLSRTAAVGANRSEIPLLTTTAVKGLSGHNVSVGRKVDDHHKNPLADHQPR